MEPEAHTMHHAFSYAHASNALAEACARIVRVVWQVWTLSPSSSATCLGVREVALEGARSRLECQLVTECADRRAAEDRAAEVKLTYLLTLPTD